ncbi:HD domain-containing protein [Trichlorobacter ammonificans]|uniref:HD_domain domain-containing protein n=1 Tax=Trichlorobacter ammonificans TaxID=2916410 RepID=A0ABM9DB70_9BACT|nr:HD domain-containing protein [Trichlorobacter ammonificans]CAH2031917.1 HD_domain domain-containing protein [Trichlorobacter ammonificans]
MQAVEELLKRYCSPRTTSILMTHGRMIAGKALAACAAAGADAETRRLVIEAAYLHDIGVCRVDAPDIGCSGSEPYIRHGLLGREILEAEGLPLHALISERHTGVGLTVGDITGQGLPLPPRDMLPQSLAERIICYADLFFSKNPERLEEEKTVENIRKSLARFGQDKVAVFEGWLREFGG